ncbi:MAG: aminodeoxychorismate/anthranilate synthase component II [Balneolaceae bacterium]
MILIIDNYDSFTYNLVHLVAASTEDYAVIRNDAKTMDDIVKMNPAGILISPGPGRPEKAGVSELVIRELGPRIPVLGVCLGHQAVGHVYGASVVYAPSLMHGKTSRVNHDGLTLFRGVEENFTATRYHSLVLKSDSVPDELEISAVSDDDVIMGVRHREYPVEGIQFHPESILTTEGPKIIRNWLEVTFGKG